MMHRSPARFLAPLALLACIGALFLIVTGTAEDASDEREAGTPATTQTTGTSTTGKKSGTRRRGRRFYTVQQGDTPSSIAEETGVPLATLLELNPDVDPQALSPGVRLRLRK